MTTKPKTISLYSGGGGLDYGFEAAGFETVAALDIDHDSCETLRKNRRWPVIERSIFATSTEEILETACVKPGEVDLVIGGPPCQPFSKSGFWVRGDSLRLHDRRADTLSAFMHVIEGTLPKAFLLENVEGLAYARKDEGLQFVLDRIQGINRRTHSSYRPHFEVLSAADFGAQLRRRFFWWPPEMERALDFRSPLTGPETEGCRSSARMSSLRTGPRGTPSRTSSPIPGKIWPCGASGAISWHRYQRETTTSGIPTAVEGNLSSDGDADTGAFSSSWLRAAHPGPYKRSQARQSGRSTGRIADSACASFAGFRHSLTTFTSLGTVGRFSVKSETRCHHFLRKLWGERSGRNCLELGRPGGASSCSHPTDRRRRRPSGSGRSRSDTGTWSAATPRIREREKDTQHANAAPTVCSAANFAPTRLARRSGGRAKCVPPL
jgi:site-specific DNA-cytosine methylase